MMMKHTMLHSMKTALVASSASLVEYFPTTFLWKMSDRKTLLGALRSRVFVVLDLRVLLCYNQGCYDHDVCCGNTGTFPSNA